MYEDDRQLARLIAEGDQEAARQLLAAHYSGLTRFFVSLGHTLDDALDLSQDTMVRVRIKANQYKGEAPFRSWLFRIAARQHAQFLRKRRLTAPLDAMLGRNQRLPELDDSGLVVWEAIRKLSSKLAVAFVLHEVEGWTTPEISRMLDIPVGTVTSRISAARRQLRHLLQDPTEDQEHVQSTLDNTQ